MRTRLLGASKEVIISDDQPTVLIGERINVAGKKKLSEALMNGNTDAVLREARAQVEAGADVLDVNVSLSGTDEVKLLTEVIGSLASSVDVPLCLDSANAEALEVVLKVCPGKPLINSVTGSEDSLNKILPLVKEHNAAVIGLVQDERGVPHDVETRIAIARKIVERAERLGIPREDVIIDCLAFAIGVDGGSGRVTLQTIRQVKSELGVNIVLGASNVSFGMPMRDVLNSAFVAMAIAAGATCLIADVAQIRQAVLAADLLVGKDKYASRFITEYRKRQKTTGRSQR